jgi:glycosyltransferase involved in cell wall biosynthesis/peptidoglycan/xylan/chitin deacetylase (PgdA/CDA1 family)
MMSDFGQNSVDNNRLDGLTILRFSHGFESGGGVEQYIDDIDSILLSRNKMRIIRFYLTETAEESAKEVKLGQGTLIKVPLRVAKNARQNISERQQLKEKLRTSIKHRIRDTVVYNQLLYRFIFRRLVRMFYPCRQFVEAIGVMGLAERVFGEYDIDLVVMHHAGGMDSGAVIAIADKTGIPFVVINHFSNDYLNSASFREQVSGCKGIAGVSSINVPKRMKNQLVSLSDGIDIEYFKPELARPIPMELQDPIIILPARILRTKGQVDLLKACLRLRNEGIKTKVVFAGLTYSLKYESELKKFMKENGLTEDVLFVGQLSREALRDWYGVASILSFPTYHYEGLPRILMETQAMEVPPVSYIIGGTPEALLDGKTGFLVPKGDLGELTRRIRELLLDECKRKRMGEEGRKFVEKNFSFEALARRHEDFYLQALRKGFNSMSPNKESSESFFQGDDIERKKDEPSIQYSPPTFSGLNNFYMEKFKATFLRPFIKRVPFSILRRIGRQPFLFLYYHVVSSCILPHIICHYRYKTPTQFIDDLDFLLINYKPLSLIEVIKYVKEDVPLPPNHFLLTFDDGLREVNDIISPILVSKGVPATFFLNSSFIDNKELCFEHKASILGVRIRKGLSSAEKKEIKQTLREYHILEADLTKSVLNISYHQRSLLDKIGRILRVCFEDYLQQNQPYLTSDQVNGLIKKGFTVGAHGIDHPHYSTLFLAEQLEQTLSSIKQIRKRFGLEYGAFAFPYNDEGISGEFFKKVRESGLVDITFGTGGIADGDLISHKQRVSLERPLLPAKEIIAWNYVRKFYKETFAVQKLKGSTGK